MSALRDRPVREKDWLKEKMEMGHSRLRSEEGQWSGTPNVTAAALLHAMRFGLATLAQCFSF